MNWPNRSQIFKVRYLYEAFIKESPADRGLQAGFKIKHTDKKYKKMAKKIWLKTAKKLDLRLAKKLDLKPALKHNLKPGLKTKVSASFTLRGNTHENSLSSTPEK